MSCETREVKWLTRGHRAGKQRCRQVTTSEPDAAVHAVTQHAATGCRALPAGRNVTWAPQASFLFLIVALETASRNRCIDVNNVFYSTQCIQNITILTNPKYRRQITRHVLVFHTECSNLACILHEQHIPFQTHHVSSIQ